MESLVQLKVGIYPSLGVVDQGQFKVFLEGEFQNRHSGIDLTIITDWDPYTLDNYEKYFSAEASSFDILEIDTILLGEVVEKQVLHELDEAKYKIKERNLEVGANAVCYKGKYYGVPTMECASFLVELAAEDINEEQKVPVFRELLKQGKITFDEFQKEVEAKSFVFDDGAMIANFRGSFTSPCFYLNAYINHHSGENVVQEGMEATIGNETEVIERMKWYASLGIVKEDAAKNPCISPERKYENPLNVIKDMRTANHRMVHAYSETIGQILADEQCQKRGIKPLGVISPPLGTQDKLLAYTDALIVSKYHYQAKAEAINLFIEFYTSLDVRNVLATMGGKPNPPYFMMSQKEFYTHGFGAKDQLYQEFYTTLINDGSKAISAPNNGFVHKRKAMDKELVGKLEWPQ